MEIKNNITIGSDAQQSFLSGISQVSQVIRQSYGPFGGNISVEVSLSPGHIIANDAESLIQAIYLEDPVERRGLNFLKELSEKASKSSGDGRKTTIIISEELLKKGFEERVQGMKAKDGLDILLPEILGSLDQQSIEVGLEDIRKVALTSSRSQEISDKIQTIYSEIGRDGIITVEGSGNGDTTYETTDGVKFKGGFLTSYMANSHKEAVYKNPIILITKKKIGRDSDVASLVDYAIKQDKALVILVDDMDESVASRLIATHRAGVAKILIIRAPVLFKNYIFEDFSKCVGATIVEPATGLNLGDSFPLEALGTCDTIVVDKEETLIRGVQDITEHKNSLKLEGSNDSLLRLQWLNTKTAVLRLGANSESELSYKLLKARDAISACSLALQGGVLEGGGKSLAKAATALGDSPLERIFKKALLGPFTQLVLNEGKVSGMHYDNLDQLLNTENIWDATIVVKNAVKNAVSLAGIILTTQGDIRLRDSTFEEKQLEILQAKRSPF